VLQIFFLSFLNIDLAFNFLLYFAVSKIYFFSVLDSGGEGGPCHPGRHRSAVNLVFGDRGSADQVVECCGESKPTGREGSLKGSRQFSWVLGQLRHVLRRAGHNSRSEVSGSSSIAIPLTNA